MSDVAQTTRNTIQGIYNRDDAQIIFMDTPGIHKPQDNLGSFMNTTAINSIYGVDIVLFVAPANEEIGHGDKFIVEKLKQVEGPKFLVLNKIDLVSKEQLLQKLTAWQELMDFDQIIPISAKSSENIEVLIDQIVKYLDEGIKYYPNDQITDHPEKFIVAEFIREKILYFTHDEVPHSIAIVIERMQEIDGEMEIMASIVVERPTQKAIIVGKQGAMIQKIRTNARKEIRRFLQMPVYLELFVKVEKNWRNKPKYLREFGYNEDDY